MCVPCLNKFHVLTGIGARSLLIYISPKPTFQSYLFYCHIGEHLFADSAPTSALTLLVHNLATIPHGLWYLLCAISGLAFVDVL